MLSAKQIELFKQLCEECGPSSREGLVRELLSKIYHDLGYQTIKDNLGSIVAFKKSSTPNPKKVLILSHMDEVGFLVKSILPNGLVKCVPLGGHYENNLPSSRVVLVNKNKEKFKGTISSVPPHLKDSKIDVSSLPFDFGFTSAEQARQMIEEGDYVSYDEPFAIIGNNKILAKALDDRFGCMLGIDILTHFKDKELNYDLYIGASVQEEIGVRGGKTVVNLVNPDLAIVLDCSPTLDHSGNFDYGKLGGGVLIRLIDGSMASFPSLIKLQVETLKKLKMPYQYYTSPGGTDAGAIHINGCGILTLTHCIVGRNIHSASTLIDIGDYFVAKDSLIEILNVINTDWEKIYERD